MLKTEVNSIENLKALDGADLKIWLKQMFSEACNQDQAKFDLYAGNGMAVWNISRETAKEVLGIQLGLSVFDYKESLKQNQSQQLQQELNRSNKRHNSEIAEKDRSLAEKDQSLAEKQHELEQSNKRHKSQIAEKDKYLAEQEKVVDWHMERLLNPLAISPPLPALPALSPLSQSPLRVAPQVSLKSSEASPICTKPLFIRPPPLESKVRSSGTGSMKRKKISSLIFTSKNQY